MSDDLLSRNLTLADWRDTDHHTQSGVLPIN